MDGGKQIITVNLAHFRADKTCSQLLHSRNTVGSIVGQIVLSAAKLGNIQSLDDSPDPRR